MDLDELRAFLTVADAGSFSGAAKSTGIVRSTLTRRIESMERSLGVRLLISNDQGIELTKHGRRLREQGPRVLAEAKALVDAVVDEAQDGTITLRCVGPQGLHHLATAQITAAVNAQCPQVSWQVTSHTSPMDALTSGEADMAIHWGLRAPEGPWSLTRLPDLPIRLLTSRDYLADLGTPSSLDELSRYDLLLWEGPDFPAGHLPLHDGSTHPISARATSQDVMVLYEMARQGCGIAFIPCLVPPGDSWIKDEAVLVLADTVGVQLSTWVVTPRALAKMESIQVMVKESLAFVSQIDPTVLAAFAPPGRAGSGAK